MIGMLLGFWDWLAPTRNWYTLSVSGPTEAFWLGPRRLSASEAANWQADAMEQYWDSVVRLHRWTGAAWVLSY